MTTDSRSTPLTADAITGIPGAATLRRGGTGGLVVAEDCNRIGGGWPAVRGLGFAGILDRMAAIELIEREGDIGWGRRTVRWMFVSRRTGKITIAQWPNAWLSVFLVATIVTRVVPAGATEAVLSWVALVGLTVWAIDEVVRGVNPFRRGLGLAVLAATAIGIALR